MEIDYVAIKVKFQGQNTPDLVDLYQQRTLTKEAEEVLRGVLIERGINVSDQPQPSKQDPAKPTPRWVVILLSILAFKMLAIGAYKAFTSHGQFLDSLPRLFPLYGPLPFVILFILIPSYAASNTHGRPSRLFSIANVGRKIVAFILAIRTIAFGAQMLGGKVEVYSFTIALLCVNIFWIGILLWPWPAFKDQNLSQPEGTDEKLH